MSKIKLYKIKGPRWRVNKAENKIMKCLMGSETFKNYQIDEIEDEINMNQEYNQRPEILLRKYQTKRLSSNLELLIKTNEEVFISLEDILLDQKLGAVSKEVKKASLGYVAKTMSPKDEADFRESLREYVNKSYLMVVGTFDHREYVHKDPLGRKTDPFSVSSGTLNGPVEEILSLFKVLKKGYLTIEMRGLWLSYD